MMPHRARIALIGVMVLWLAAPAYAGFSDGITDLVTAPFELPKQVLAGTLSGPPIVGTVAGAVVGTFATAGKVLRGVGGLATGVLNLGSALAPLAPYVLPFVL